MYGSEFVVMWLYTYPYAFWKCTRGKLSSLTNPFVVYDLSMDGMKRCPACDTLRPRSAFTESEWTRSGAYCRDCKRDYNARRKSERFDAPGEAKAGRVERRDRNRRIVRTWLREHPCADCGESDAAVLNFEYREGVEKSDTPIGVMVSNGMGEDALDTELAKCYALCHNCRGKREADAGGRMAWRRDADW